MIAALLLQLAWAAPCPERDADHDSIPDPHDPCPLDAGPADAAVPGCPRGRPLRPPLFPMLPYLPDPDRVPDAGEEVLAQVAEALAAHPELTHFHLSGRALPDDADSAARAQRRADAVRSWLVAAGIAPERLTACTDPVLLAPDGEAPSSHALRFVDVRVSAQQTP